MIPVKRRPTGLPSMNYMLDGEPVTVSGVAREFSAYSIGLVRDGLRAGHDTRVALLTYLTHRTMPQAPLKPRESSKPKLYSARGNRG